MGEYNAVLAICNTRAEAEAAMKGLTPAAFHIKKFSVVGQDHRPAKHTGEYSSTVDWIKYCSMGISGIGPVLIAGPLLGWVLGALEETVVAVGSTAIGRAFRNMGIHKDSVLSYETALRFGRFLLLVHGTEEEVARAQHIMQTERARTIVDLDASAAKKLV